VWYKFSKIILAAGQLQQMILKLLNGDKTNYKKAQEATANIPSNKAKFIAAFYINKNENVDNLKFYLERLPNTFFDNLMINNGDIKYKFLGKAYDLPDNFNKFAEFIDENYVLEQTGVTEFKPNSEAPLEIHFINDVKDALKFASLPFPRTPWCITWPLHKNNQYWAYRQNSSTFYIVIDNTRDVTDRFYAVAVDAKPNNLVFTHFYNGAAITPGNQMYDEYFDYLKNTHGIDKSIFVNKPLTKEEVEIQKRVGDPIYSVEEFDDLKNSDLVKDLQMKYIEYPHKLTEDQFEYLLKNKENQLINAYCNTNLLSDQQIELLKKYNRNQDLKTSSRKEDKIINENIQPERHLNLLEISDSNARFLKKLVSLKIPVRFTSFADKAFKNSNFESIDYLHDNGILQKHRVAITSADSLKYIIDKNLQVASVDWSSVLANAFEDGDLETIKLCDNYVDVNHDAIYSRRNTPNFDVFKYLLEKGVSFTKFTWESSIKLGLKKNDLRLIDEAAKQNILANLFLTPLNFEQFEYLLNKGWRPKLGSFEYIFKKILRTNNFEYLKSILDYIKKLSPILQIDIIDELRSKIKYSDTPMIFPMIEILKDESKLKLGDEKIIDFMESLTDEQLRLLLENKDYLKILMNTSELENKNVEFHEKLFNLGVNLTKHSQKETIFSKFAVALARRNLGKKYSEIFNKFYDSGALENFQKTVPMGSDLIEYFLKEKNMPVKLLKKILNLRYSLAIEPNKEQILKTFDQLNLLEQIEPDDLRTYVSIKDLIKMNYKNFDMMFNTSLNSAFEEMYAFDSLVSDLQENDYLKNINIRPISPKGIERTKKLLAQGLINMNQIDTAHPDPEISKIEKDYFDRFLPTQNLQDTTQNLQDTTQNVLPAVEEENLDLSDLNEPENDDNIFAFNLKRWIKS